MEFFRTLGLSIAREWQAKNWADSALADVATEALVRTPPSDHVSLIDVVRWVHTTQELVPQGSPHYKFGDPPIRVFESERFYIEVLCWVDGTTSIHQHSFSGAFHVMQGSSLHTQHRFEEEGRFNDFLLSGKLHLRKVELLKKGATRPIRSGRGLVHALFHLDRPSISVVVRNFADAVNGPQHAFLRPCLAFDPFFNTAQMRKMAETLRLLYITEHPGFEELAVSSIEHADAQTAFHLMHELMNFVEPYTRYRELIARVAPSAHPELTAMILQVEEERRREQNIVLRRRQIKQAEHRFLLALLLNIPSRGHIFDLVRAAYPDRDPVDAIMGWVKELSGTKLQGSEESLVGFDLEGAELDVLRPMIAGATDEEVLAVMEKSYSREEAHAMRADILELCAAFRQSLLLKPLFVP